MYYSDSIQVIEPYFKKVIFFSQFLSKVLGARPDAHSSTLNTSFTEIFLFTSQMSSLTTYGKVILAKPRKWSSPSILLTRLFYATRQFLSLLLISYCCNFQWCYLGEALLPKPFSNPNSHMSEDLGLPITSEELRH